MKKNITNLFLLLFFISNFSLAAQEMNKKIMMQKKFNRSLFHFLASNIESFFEEESAAVLDDQTHRFKTLFELKNYVKNLRLKYNTVFIELKSNFFSSEKIDPSLPKNYIIYFRPATEKIIANLFLFKRVLLEPSSWINLQTNPEDYRISDPININNLKFDQYISRKDEFLSQLPAFGIDPNKVDHDPVTLETANQSWHLDTQDIDRIRNMRQILGQKNSNPDKLISFITLSKDNSVGTDFLRVPYFDYSMSILSTYFNLDSDDISHIDVIIERAIEVFLNDYAGIKSPYNDIDLSLITEKTRVGCIYSGIANLFIIDHQLPKVSDFIFFSVLMI